MKIKDTITSLLIRFGLIRPKTETPAPRFEPSKQMAPYGQDLLKHYEQSEIDLYICHHDYSDAKSQQAGYRRYEEEAESSNGPYFYHDEDSEQVDPRIVIEGPTGVAYYTYDLAFAVDMTNELNKAFRLGRPGALEWRYPDKGRRETA